MISKGRNYLFFLSLTLLLMLGSCGGKKIDISGAVEGIWKTDWSQKKVDSQLHNMDVSETIAFANDNEAGTAGKFRQVYIGGVDYEGPAGNGRYSFAVVVSGQWQVTDIDGLKLMYNLDNMSSMVSKTAPNNNAEAISTMLKGDWTGSVSATLGSGIDAAGGDENVKQVINTYFRDQFRKANSESAAMKHVVVDNKMMTAKVNGDKVTYFKSEQNVKDLIASASSASADSSYDTGTPQVLPESSVAPVQKSHSTPAGLPDYDWLSTTYVNYNDLAGKSGSQLRIMRNYIYARHGYRFKSKDLQRYFAQYPWYSPMYSDVNHLLNKIEKSNIQTISAYE